jgi:hypothetical protein
MNARICLFAFNDADRLLDQLWANVDSLLLAFISIIVRINLPQKLILPKD